MYTTSVRTLERFEHSIYRKTLADLTFTKGALVHTRDIGDYNTSEIMSVIFDFGYNNVWELSGILNILLTKNRDIMDSADFLIGSEQFGYGVGNLNQSFYLWKTGFRNSGSIFVIHKGKLRVRRLWLF